MRAPPAAPSAFDGVDAPSLEGLRACVHCGICLPACPTYRVLGEEMDSPRGRLYLMRAAAEGRAGLTSTLARHLDLCLGCRACETACPSGVPFGQLLEASRGQLHRRAVNSRETDGRALDRALRLFPHPARLGPLLPALRAYQRSGLQELVRRSRALAPFPSLRAMESLLPPVPPPAPPLPERIPARARRRGVAGLLVGCVQRFFYPDVNAQTARLLSAAGYDVLTPAGQGCCGALHLHAGRIDEFRPLARALLSAFGDEVDLVVTNAAGCGSVLREYGHWLDGEGPGGFAAIVRDVSEVLVEAHLPLREIRETVTYHDPCHLVHGQRVRTAPRELLRRIPGLRLIELGDSELCCGSAGVYNLVERAMADELARRKLARIRETGARVVASGNPGCLLQIARAAAGAGLDLEVVHVVELVGRALRD